MSYDENRVLVIYIMKYYPRLMTRFEFEVLNNLFMKEGAEKFYARTEPPPGWPLDIWKRKMRDFRERYGSSVDIYLRSENKDGKFVIDPLVIDAMKHGLEKTLNQVCERILREHANEFKINRCPSCDKILRTPIAQFCVWCGQDWHKGPATGSGS